MAKTALEDLQRQIDAIRRQAFEAGYAAAMKAVHELASQSPAAPSRRGRRRGRGRVASKSASRPRRSGLGIAPASRTRSRQRRPQRGANARMIVEILQAAAPRALPQAQIRKALQEKGISLAFTSIRHALGQLEARNAAKQVGNSRTWRYSAG
jgi:hypothetical protein